MLDGDQIGTAALIDDDEVHIMMYERAIKKSGLIKNILKFEMAEDALDHLRQPDRDKVDVIFLDINMPRMNGFEFLDEANRTLGPNFAGAVIIMLTTSLNPDDHAKAERYDVVKDFLNKPLSVDDVAKVVELVRAASP